MANQEHVDIFLLQNVIKWNLWIADKRADDSSFSPDLSEANLSGADLIGANLSGANLRWANLSGTDFRNTNLSGANLSEANLSAADLSAANLSGKNSIRCNFIRANLVGADLSGADLRRTNLSGANLSEANLSAADLSEANLSGADLSEANLSEANLSEANLSGADLVSANLTKVCLTDANLKEAYLGQANLTEADLRTAKNFILTNTVIKDSHFPNKASDPWSTLRQKYTGPMLLFHLVFLIVFFGFNMFQVFIWTGINTLQTGIYISQQNFPVELGQYILQQSEEVGISHQVATTISDRVKQKVTNLTQDLTPCLKDDCTDPLPAWKLLLNLHDSLLRAILTITLLAYNIFRAGFTWWIGLLRDAEERSNRSPGYSSYIWWYRVHFYFMTPILTMVFLSIIINGYDMLFNITVILPVTR